MNTRVVDLLGKKGREVVRVEPTASVQDAAAQMVKNRVGSVLIADGDDIHGLLCERDFVQRVVLEERNPRFMRAHEAITNDVVFVSPEHQVEDCLRLMTERRCRHLPVVRSGHVVGLVSIGDCVAHLRDRAMVENADLYAYITGHYPG